MCLTPCLSIISWKISPPVIPMNLARVSNLLLNDRLDDVLRFVHLDLLRVEEGLDMIPIRGVGVERGAWRGADLTETRLLAYIDKDRDKYRQCLAEIVAGMCAWASIGQYLTRVKRATKR